MSSTNPATMPRRSPTIYNQVVCSQRSHAVPISQPISVAAGKIMAKLGVVCHLHVGAFLIRSLPILWLIVRHFLTW